MVYFFHHRMAPKTKPTAKFVQDFYIIFVDLCSISSFSKLIHIPQGMGNYGFKLWITQDSKGLFFSTHFEHQRNNFTLSENLKNKASLHI